MCGISGIINKNLNRVDKDEIQHMNDLISHRGPDDEGFYFEKNFAFGHRRLSILDLSSDGHQPMHYLDKYVITYNGEVYNYLEIKEELLKYGYTFHSHTDTEVILASYDKWGEECVNKFNGMWAFAIYDKEKNIIFCSRDRFGVKPFYYTQVDEKFIFGSEIKQLLEFYQDRYVNKKVLMNYLVTGFHDFTNDTFFEKIEKLEGSHNLVYNLNTNDYLIKKYYSINIDDSIKNLEEDIIINKYEEDLSNSIKLRLRSDVRVGTCLSGGIDSSAITAIASKFYEYNNKFIAIHAKSIEKITDESKYAYDVSNSLDNVDLKIVEPSTKDFINNIDEVILTQEEPFGSPSIFMQYFVMREAKKLNCKVMLDGQGGDETLLGYERYYPAAYIDLMKNRGFISMIKEVLNTNKNNSKMSFLWIIKLTFGSILFNLRIKKYIKKCFFVKNEYLINNKFDYIKEFAEKYFNVNELQKYEITNLSIPVLLRYEDKNSMKHSIETRLPFLDFNVLELALSIDTKIKIKKGWTKYLLRSIIDKLLPNSVVWRKSKLGFNAPERIWIDENELIMLNEISKSKILNKITNMKILLLNYSKFDYRLKWRLFNIACWERIYNVKI
ncbi:asparagine synthase (glutamine-hydrolyzing) [Arcobacter lacus]|uniref:asparagine synthase (glutamine-hydrolyzing) n=1 Tax=Arcobacter lacus TaxID=1912876 RepID=UPI0021BA43EB|nr:asparagine synthase (glutamine-hydrolyzing) [Arcobacter lacus]MCT7911790.1 asparagine synthase (glutamine-hydrolyzing) [Arcobacter lacus]